MNEFNQVLNTRNQGIGNFESKYLFLFDNRWFDAVLKNNTGVDISLKTGILAVRNAGKAQVATVVFSATPLSAGQTVILGGLTYTSTGATTAAQLAAAFANLANGATTGAGTATGTYSGALTGFSTGNVINGTSVVFTAATRGVTTPLAQTGTGAASAITVVAGVAAVAGQVFPATAATIHDVIGIVTSEGVVTLADAATANVRICDKGTIDPDYLVLPAGITLDSVPANGNKTLADYLRALGINIEPATELTKFDNQ